MPYGTAETHFKCTSVHASTTSRVWGYEIRTSKTDRQHTEKKEKEQKEKHQFTKHSTEN